MREIKISALDCVAGGWFFTPFIWGFIVGAVSYLTRKKDKPFDPDAFAAASIGGGVSGSFGALGAAGKIVSLVNGVNTYEAVSKMEGAK